MARLKNTETNEEIILRTQHSFGRTNKDLALHRRVDTQFDEHMISKNHASIRWSGEHWVINDNNSTNGTQVNKQKVKRWQVLKLDDVICFGGSLCWRVIDLSAPRSFLLGINEDSHNIYTDEESEQDHGIWLSLLATGECLLIQEGNERLLNDGELVTAQPKYLWRFYYEGSTDNNTKVLQGNTNDTHEENNCALLFDVSPCEEHIKLSVLYHDQTIDLGERVTHYLLLLLARQMQADLDKGYKQEDCGWLGIAELQDMTGLDYSHINTQIWRAKKNFDSKTKNKLDSNLIERRASEARLSIFNLNIR